MDAKTGSGKVKFHLQICKDDGNYRPSIIWADFFARFRFNLEELMAYLKGVSGKLYSDAPFAYQCLDDLGYWTFIRQSDVFELTPELENSLRHQFDFLSSVFEYSIGDTLLWGDLNRPQTKRFLVSLVEKVVEGEQELFRVELISSGATILVSRFELDYWNAAGSSLPNDTLVETIDWDRDAFWLKRLSDFKEKMANKQFQFNFGTNASEIAKQQNALLHEVQAFFTLSPGSKSQSGRGLGYLACGQGDYEDTALVMAFAIQALGLQFGIRARLWGFEKEEKTKPSFLLIQTDKSGLPIESWRDLTLNHPLYRPIQRPLSEVLRKVLANGPFGKEESLILVRGSLEEPLADESLIHE